MRPGLCLGKRKKPADPDVNQQDVYVIEILVFRFKGSSFSSGLTFLHAEHKGPSPVS